MPRPRRPRLTQHIPDAPRALFAVVEYTPGATFFEITLREPGWIKHAIDGYEPIFRYVPPRTRPCPFSIQQIANAGAGELAEARGLVTIVEFQDGIPVFSAIYSSDSRQVVCRQSSDATRAQAYPIRQQRETPQEEAQSLAALRPPDTEAEPA